MTEWIISSSMLILIVLAVRAFFKGKIRLNLQYAIWLLVLARLLIPVSFGNTDFSVINLKESAQELPAVQAVMDIGRVNVPVQSYEDAYDHVVQRYESEGIKVETLQGSELEVLEYEAYELMKGPELSEMVFRVLRTVWIGGMVTVGAVFLYTNLRFGRRLRRSRRDLNIRADKLTVYVTDETDTPCLFGLFRPAVYITGDAVEDPVRLRHIIAHESTHYRHGDHIWPLLRCLCLAVHWYNPLVWWAAVLSQRDSELACDEATVKRLGEGERAEYGRTLIGMTCRKRANPLITATTMTGSKGGIRERISLIAKKPKMAVYTLAAVLLIAAVAVGCTFTGARSGDEAVPEDMGDPELETESGDANTLPVDSLHDFVLETEYVDPASLPADPPDLIPVFPKITGLQDRGEDDKFCIAVWPVAEEYQGDAFKYIIPENQEDFIDAFEKAMEELDTEYLWNPEVGGCGWKIVYQGKFWTGMNDGSILGWMDGVNAEAAADLHGLCTAAVRDAGINLPARPDEFKDIRSATLQWDDRVYTIADEYGLQRLESLLINSKSINGAGCFFGAILTLELENGEMKNIFMATDACGTWISEGAYYEFGLYNEDGAVHNDVLYSLFAHELIREAAVKGMDELTQHLNLLDWSRYGYFYGSDEAFALMDMVYAYIFADLDQRRTWTMELTEGLDGAYADRYAELLDQVFEEDREGFARTFMAHYSIHKKQIVLDLLANHWKVSVEEARRILEMETAS